MGDTAGGLAGSRGDVVVRRALGRLARRRDRATLRIGFGLED
jgi:hypothetical protein